MTEIKNVPGRRGVWVPVDTLHQDTLIVNAHARQLSSSIETDGQNEAVIVWSGRAPNGDNVANGRHRAQAIRLLDRTHILADVLDFDLEGFYSAQITASTPHDALQAARIPHLVKAVFQETTWADKVDEIQAFRIPQAINQRKPSYDLARKGLPIEEQKELADWVIRQSEAWMLTPGRVVSILKLANVVEPSLLSLVGTRPEGEPPFTEPMLRRLSTNVPDREWQVAVAEVAFKQRLGEHDFRRLVDTFAQTSSPSEMRAVLDRSWVTRIEPVAKPEPVIVNEQVKKLERNMSEIYAIRHGVRAMGEAADALRTMPIKRHPSMRDQVAAGIADIEAAIAEYRGEEKSNVIAQLTEQVDQLRGQVETLQRSNHLLERRLGAAERSRNIHSLNENAKLGRPD